MVPALRYLHQGVQGPKIHWSSNRRKKKFVMIYLETSVTCSKATVRERMFTHREKVPQRQKRRTCWGLRALRQQAGRNSGSTSSSIKERESGWTVGLMKLDDIGAIPEQLKRRIP